AASFPDSMTFGLDESDLEQQIAQAVAGFDMGAVADAAAAAQTRAGSPSHGSQDHTGLKPGELEEGTELVVSEKDGLVDVGGLMRGFIPASQVDTRFVKDISELFGQTVRCEVTKIERDAQNLVVSRRKVLEREAAEAKTRMLTELTEGLVRRGRVRNVTDFGA